jgi:hypothetical protein
MRTESTTTADVVRLLLGVARLGENDLRGWWKGHALDGTGAYVLSNMFRRTWRPAALELDVAAAAAMHIELLGRATALHLFSDLLPFRGWVTGWLAEQKTAPEPDPLLVTLQGWTLDEATDTLRSWCGRSDAGSGETLGVGILLGRLSAANIADPSTIYQYAHLLTAAYVDQTGPLRPPYFDLAR